MISETTQSTPTFQVCIHNLARVVSHVLPAMDDDSSRFALASVRIEIRGNQLTAVATDGRQLAYSDCELIQSPGDDCEFLIPAKAAKALVKLCTKNAKPTATVKLDSLILPREISIVWTAHNAKTRSVEFSPLEGRFPDWRSCIPTRQDGNNEAAVLTASAKTFLDSFSLVNENVGTLFDTGAMELRTATVKLPKKTKRFEGIEQTGADIVFAWDIDFPIAWLNTLPETCQVSFHVESANKAILGVCDDVNAFYVVMPMSIEN